MLCWVLQSWQERTSATSEKRKLGIFGRKEDVSIHRVQPTRYQHLSNWFISVRRCTCFRRVFHPSSGAQICTYSVRYLSDRYCYLPLATVAVTVWQYLTLYVQFSASDEGRKTPQQVAVTVWQIPDAVCAVLGSWWWTENPSDTCTASYGSK